MCSVFSVTGQSSLGPHHAPVTLLDICVKCISYGYCENSFELFSFWQSVGTASWWLWCGVCLLFLASPVVPGFIVSAPCPVPPFVPSSTLLSCSANKSLFLSHFFFYSLCLHLSWRGKTFPQLSQSPQTSRHILPQSVSLFLFYPLSLSSSLPFTSFCV